MAFATPRDRRRKGTAIPSFVPAKSKSQQKADAWYTKLKRNSPELVSPDIEPSDMVGVGKLGVAGLLALPALVSSRTVAKSFGRRIANKFEDFTRRGFDYKPSDFVATPKKITRKMLDWMTDGGKRNIGKTLEPHAGEGHMVQEIYKRTGVMPHTLEVNMDRYLELSVKGIPSQLKNFLNHTGKKYDSIFMNPPFSRGQAKYHVLHGESLLEEGGRMTALVPAREVMGRSGYKTPLAKWIEQKDNVEFLGTGSMPSGKSRTSVAILGIRK